MRSRNQNLTSNNTKQKIHYNCFVIFFTVSHPILRLIRFILLFFYSPSNAPFSDHLSSVTVSVLSQSIVRPVSVICLKISLVSLLHLTSCWSCFIPYSIYTISHSLHFTLSDPFLLPCSSPFYENYLNNFPPSLSVGSYSFLLLSFSYNFPCRTTSSHLFLFFWSVHFLPSLLLTITITLQLTT